MDLERRLSEKEQEAKDLEVKLFEASFTSGTRRTSFDEDAPIVTKKKNSSRSLFDDEPLPTARKQESRPDLSSQNIANRHKVGPQFRIYSFELCHNYSGLLHLLQLQQHPARPEEARQVPQQRRVQDSESLAHRVRPDRDKNTN